MKQPRRPPTRRSLLPIGEEIESPRTGAILEIRNAPARGAEGALELRRTLKPGMGRAGSHVHLDFTETFVIEKGIADARLDRHRQRLSEGQTFYVAPGEPHVNPYNAEIEQDLVLFQSFSPATESVRSYVQTLATLLKEGRDENGDVPRWLIYAIGVRTRGRTYADGRPIRLPFGLQRRVLLPVGARVAGSLGYTVEIPRDPERKERLAPKRRDEVRRAPK